MEENRRVYLVNSGGRYYFWNEFTLGNCRVWVIIRRTNEEGQHSTLGTDLPQSKFFHLHVLYSFSRSLWPPRHFGHPG